MGRGQIIAHLGDGQYSVRLNYAYRDRVNQKLAILSGQITELDIRIAAETDASRRSTLNLQRAAAQRMYDYYSTRMPADPSVDAWCADLTEDMAYGTVVGTIEIPGEATTVLVRPAYDNRAIYSAPRDGQLMPSIAGEPNQVLFNWMLLPGWQRHKPIYRSGTIIADSLDFDANTCSVCLDPAFSSQQSLPAIDGATAADCNMGDDAQSSLLTARAADFCDRNPSHPFCTQTAGSEVYLSPQMLADLQSVNNYVNTNYGRQGDPSGLRAGDSWDVMAPGGAGDCEDFALTKMQRLVSNYGFSPDSLKMVTGYTQNGDYHAMLGVRTTNRGLVLLDVNYNEVMDNARLPYRLDKIALDSETWVNYTRRLDAVPIEYMTCNAGAFADGDRVVIQFTSQDWAQPKVIGFLENPQPCSYDAWNIGNNGSGTEDYSFWKYTYHTDSWGRYGEVPGYDSFGWIRRNGQFEHGDRSDFRLFGNSDGGDGTFNYEESWPEDWWYGEDRSDRYFQGIWQVLQSMPSIKSGGASFSISGDDYCVSGGRAHLWMEYSPTDKLTEYVATASNDAYNINANSWSSKQQLNREMFSLKSFKIGDRGYCFGGYYGWSDDYDDLEYHYFIYQSTEQLSEYNPLSNSWAGKQSMLRARHSCGASVIGGIGHLFPGKVTPDGVGDGDTPFYNNYIPSAPVLTGGFTDMIEKYDANSDAWSIGPRRFLSNREPEWVGDPDVPYHYASSDFTIGPIEAVGFCERWTVYNSVAETLTARENLFLDQGRNSNPTAHSVLAA